MGREGKLEDEFEMLEPKTIKDPDQSKPEDWVDEKMIADPESIKPEGYDDIPSEIPDPDASKPDDWDDEDDGEWTPTMIDNPEYKGPWTHPKIPNPDYVYDDKMYAVCPDGCSHIGFEIWQVKSGTIFDDIIITDSLEEAQKFAEHTFFAKKGGEKAMYDDVQNVAAAEAEDDDEMELDMDDDDILGDMEEEF